MNPRVYFLPEISLKTLSKTPQKTPKSPQEPPEATSRARQDTPRGLERAPGALQSGQTPKSIKHIYLFGSFFRGVWGSKSKVFVWEVLQSWDF